MLHFSVLVERLYARQDSLSRDDCDLAARTILREIGGHLVGGGRVEVRGFGAFTVRTRGAIQGRNPKTGACVDLPARARPYFRPGKTLREGVNGRGE